MTSRSGDSLVDRSRRGDVETVSRSEQGPAAQEPARRKPDDAPDLTVEQVLTWADEYHAAHGAWPDIHQMTGLGPIEGAPGETWKAVNYALAMGTRGLPGDSSLAELLAEHRGTPRPELGPDALAKKLWSWEQEHFPVRKPRIRLGPRRGRPLLTIREITDWAKAHLAATGTWPDARSGTVRDAPFTITWSALQSALTQGLRGLPQGFSLARLRNEHFGINPRCKLTIEQILAWADAHHAATGRWPTEESGPLIGAPHEKWKNLALVVRVGHRGMPGGQSLARLLEQHRGVVSKRVPSSLTIDQILAWADAHHEATGNWPTRASGPLRDAPYETTWKAVDADLKKGSRGLPGGTTLFRLLAEQRGVHAPLNVERILAWADAHHASTGCWPTQFSGEIADGLTWCRVSRLLSGGGRGLPGGSSLVRLLAERRGYRNKADVPKLTVEQIVTWADAHHAATRCWPNPYSGPIKGVPGETWKAIESALVQGLRGLPRGWTLPRLLAEHRGYRNRSALPDLTPEQILAWADAHRAVTGHWPGLKTGPVAAAPGETWNGINWALAMGSRGLPGGSSLARLLAEQRGRRNHKGLRKLTPDGILAWADAHFAATGRWPSKASGPVAAAPGETWLGIHVALSSGIRGLPGGSTLASLLDEARQRPIRRIGGALTPEQILAWCDHQRTVTGSWPTKRSGAVLAAPDETWGSVDRALRTGARSLCGGSSLARLLDAHRRVADRRPESLLPTRPPRRRR
jgi:hypothetical protein